MSRPGRLVVVTGTGTEVGKTWVGAELLKALRLGGSTVAALKPAQSFSPSDEATDAHVLGAATGASAWEVCPPDRWYPVPMAPPMAAEVLALPVPTIADLIGQVERSWPAPAVQFGLVEGAGGVASPLATDGHTADLARALGADVVVLVADAGLGTINSVRLSVTALAPLPAVVYLNRFEPAEELHRRNLQWLAERDGFAVTTSVDHLAEAVGRLDIGNKVEPPPHPSPVGPAEGENDVELAQLLGTAAEGDAG